MKKYTELEMEVITFEQADVITASGVERDDPSTYTK